MTSDKVQLLISDITSLLSDDGRDRELIEAILLSISSAMERVPLNARSELQTLVATYCADPDDAHNTAKLGAMLRDARASDH